MATVPATASEHAPLISVVMTVRDGARYLAQALESVCSQTLRGWELVLRDDGSTDNTLAIARDFAARDPRIRCIAGPSVGRRAALVDAHSHARAPYLAWLDADDWLAPDALAKAHAALISSSSDLVYTDHIVVDTNGNHRGLGRRAQIPYSPHRLLLDFMTFHLRVFSRDIFERAGGISPDREIAIDYDLCLRISEHGRIQHLAEPLYFYRQHADQMSTRRRSEQVAASAAAIRAALARRRLAYSLSVDESHGHFRLVPRHIERPRTSWPRIALATLAPRIAARFSPLTPGSADATDASYAAVDAGYAAIGAADIAGTARTIEPTRMTFWPTRPSLARRLLHAALEARNVHVRPLGSTLVRLVRGVWTGRAGDVLHIDDLSPLFASPEEGSVLAALMLFAKTLDHARARGTRIVWTAPSPLVAHPRHPRLYKRATQDIARRCDEVVTHWPSDVAHLASLGANAHFVPHPSLGDAFPIVTREAARTSLGLALDIAPASLGLAPDIAPASLGLASDIAPASLGLAHDTAPASLGLAPDISPRTLLYLGAAPAIGGDLAGTLVLDGDIASFPARHVAAYFAAADLVVIPAPTAELLALAMAMGKPIVAPAVPHILDIVGAENFVEADLAMGLARAHFAGDGRSARDVWMSIGESNARRARAMQWTSLVECIVGPARNWGRSPTRVDGHRPRGDR